MSSKALKFLTFFFLFTLTACAPIEQQQTLVRTPPSLNLYTEYPPGISSPEPFQTTLITPSHESAQQFTPITSPSPTVLPPPDTLTSPGLHISQLQMLDANTGWAVYSSPFIRPETSKILRTTDGIQNWMDVTPPVSENRSIVRAAYFVDANTALIFSSRSSPPDSPAVEAIPWRTSDGDQTWQEGETLLVDQASLFYPSQLFFLDSEHGWMLGESDSGMGNMRVHIFETQDGGMQWEMVYDSVDHLSDQETLWIKGYYPYVDHFTFTSKTTGFISNGRLFSSPDGGRTWAFRQLEAPIDLPDIDCQGGDCKYLDTVSAPRFTSVQDGHLIRRAYMNSEVVMDVIVYYPNTLNRLPLPVAQYLYFTHDGGKTWVPKSTPVKIGAVFFKDANLGWLLGKNDPDPKTASQLYQTIDGGETWSQISANSPLPLGSELQFVDEQIGYAFYPFSLSDYYKDFDTRIAEAAQHSFLFTTQDGGHSWANVELKVTP